jgi:microcin C transport system permease protein
MAAYILRRLLLIIPTLLGIMFLNFTIIQFAPGGPVEQQIAELTGIGSNATDRFTGGGAETSTSGGEGSSYRGAQGLDPEFVAELEAQFGFVELICEPGYEGPERVSADECRGNVICEPGYTGEQTASAAECEAVRIPWYKRFTNMVWDYVRFDFGESYFRSISVIDLIKEKMPVSISLGLWTTLIAYLISIPMGVQKAVRDGSSFDTWTSAIVIVGYALPAFLFAVMLRVFFAGGSFLQIFPLRGLESEQYAGVDFWEKASQLAWWGDYFWHLVLPVAAMVIGSFATMTLLTKNSFLDEIRKQYVLTARAKGLSENGVLFGHVFRNAMLIIVAGFPAAFVGVFFTGSLLIETIFSLDGLGLLGFNAIVERDYPVVFGTLYMFSLVGLLLNLVSDLIYVWIDPRIDFESRGG